MIIHCCLPWDWHWPPWSLSPSPSLLLFFCFLVFVFFHTLFFTCSCHPVSDSPLHQALICSSLAILPREEDENRAHGATKEQIACRQECPRFEWHVMFFLSKNRTFSLSVWGYHPALKLNKDTAVCYLLKYVSKSYIYINQFRHL